MKTVKLAAMALMPPIFFCRHPHIEGHGFVPEPQPANPFVLLSTATAQVLAALFPELPELEGPRFRIVL
jgi:hypothetical protein